MNKNTAIAAKAMIAMCIIGSFVVGVVTVIIAVSLIAPNQLVLVDKFISLLRGGHYMFMGITGTLGLVLIVILWHSTNGLLSEAVERRVAHGHDNNDERLGV